MRHTDAAYITLEEKSGHVHPIVVGHGLPQAYHLLAYRVCTSGSYNISGKPRYISFPGCRKGTLKVVIAYLKGGVRVEQEALWGGCGDNLSEFRITKSDQPSITCSSSLTSRPPARTGAWHCQVTPQKKSFQWSCATHTEVLRVVNRSSVQFLLISGISQAQVDGVPDSCFTSWSTDSSCRLKS